MPFACPKGYQEPHRTLVFDLMQVFHRGIVVNCSPAVCFRTKPAESMNGNSAPATLQCHHFIGGGALLSWLSLCGPEDCSPSRSLSGTAAEHNLLQWDTTARAI